MRATIAALASGRPPSAIAVIRVSGPNAFPVIERLIEGGCLPSPRRASLRRLIHPTDAAVIDDALVLRFPGPASATGEDVAELHCHGSSAVIAAILEMLSAEGVRAAEPGEFTRRAFEAGRLDLTQVEGLADVLAATTEAQRAQAAAQAGGLLRQKAEGWADGIIQLLAGLEAALDFADEADAATASLDRTAAITLADEIADALASFTAGCHIREGVKCAIVGAPNAGKSSLFNALLGRPAAIVADTPGTTRDLIEAHLVLGGVPVTLIDTAGLRQSGDAVEMEGVRRARAELAEAELVIAASENSDWPTLPDGAIRVRTKADLGVSACETGEIAASAHSGVGLDVLRLEMTRRVLTLTRPGEAKLVTNQRQGLALQQAEQGVRGASEVDDDVLAAEMLRSAMTALERLIGRRDAEAMLDALFSRFCIGK